MFKNTAVFLLVLFVVLPGCKNKNPTSTEKPSDGPAAVSDIIVDESAIWLATGSGLARSQDGGSSWTTYSQTDGLPRGGISALHIRDNEIWVAAGFDSLDLTAGGGLSYSPDYGQTWNYIPQPGPTPMQNVTYDIAVQNNTVWITSFGGGLKKSNDYGNSWEIVTPDTFEFDPLQHLNHRAFSVIAFENELWVGTAEGINRSLDGGETWQNFRHQNQSNAISGNFVVALKEQFLNGSYAIWAATRHTIDLEEFDAVSKSPDSGLNWHVFLNDVVAHNIAVSDSGVFVAAQEGLFHSPDGGITWRQDFQFVDSEKNIQFSSEEIFYVNYVDDPASDYFGLWVGGPEGLAHSLDNGNSWSIQVLDEWFESKTISLYLYKLKTSL
jgi:photosystem II stability/assembly factor-like uncharacterized protein